MAKKISQLTQATEVKSDDVTVIVQDGETKKLPLNMMVTKQDIENKKVAGLAKLDEIEATYENDTYTPTITVKNKSSVKTGEGDEVDYSANVMDGHAKSAILSGQTLVNLATTTNFSMTTSGSIAPLRYTLPTGTYTIMADITLSSDGSCLLGFYEGHGQSRFNTKIFTSSGKYIWTENITNGNIKSYGFYVTDNLTTDVTYTLNNLVILSGDHTQEDIPYFTGMQSVKLPVLHTIGKNLLSGYINGGLNANTGEDVSASDGIRTSFIAIDNAKSYYLSNIPSQSWNYVAYYDSNKQFIRRTGAGAYTSRSLSSSNGQVRDSGYRGDIFPCNAKYIKLTSYQNVNTGDVAAEELLEMSKSTQLEEGSAATSYEPYKSNILTVNEDIELRGIGEVKDELNLLTGELTQRVGELFLNGTKGDIIIGNDNNPDLDVMQFFIKGVYYGGLFDRKQISDRLPQGFNNNNYEHFYVSSSTIVVFVKKTDLETEDVDGFKKWLSKNPITIYFNLVQPTIKTVDLMPSGTHPSTTPYCWKNGHIQLSSSGLLPNLEYSVVTSRAGQINQNATMVVKNDKRIFDLEILLAGGLVNTTYQALTLQNQVETGLSKVSLSSETEPDYLLYHMIMKLIEEKAYKLDDLTEKVSVFYLYEKLSDEQFETIYSALYPFVEDEIVEEPVVEELPEVVEDEVIM